MFFPRGRSRVHSLRSLLTWMLVFWREIVEGRQLARTKVISLAWPVRLEPTRLQRVVQEYE